MAHRDDGRGSGLLFILGCYILYQAGFEQGYIWIAIYLWLVFWLSIKLFSIARFRLHRQAWVLAGVTLLCLALFTWLWSPNTVANITYAVGIGFPLVFLAAGARLLYDRFDWLKEIAACAGLWALCAVPAVTVIYAVRSAEGFWPGVITAASALAWLSVSLAIGWQFGAAPPPRDGEARFGGDADFTRARISHEP